MSSTSQPDGATIPKDRTYQDHAHVPTVTVIVPTYNRSHSIGDTLGCLAVQDYPATSLDIIVVDNSSIDNTEQVVRDVSAQSRIPIRYFRKKNEGPAAARNFGLDHSSAEIVGFTDSDCHVGPDWVRNAVRLMGPGVGLVSGPIRPMIHHHRKVNFFHHQIEEITHEHALYPTANIFYQRDAVDKAGKFDESYGAYAWGPPKGGEDTDLAWRVKRGGFASAFAEDAPVYHEATNIGIKSWLIEPVRTQIVPCMVSKFPELRESYLWHRYFLNRYNPAFYLALLGVLTALLSRQRWAVALSLPWLWLMRPLAYRDLWPPLRWWRIPIKYVLMFERFTLLGCTLIYSSIRHRAIVL